jgi:hypothetical protein
MEGKDKNKYQYRHVSFKNIVYSLQNGKRMDVIPVLYWDNNEYNNLLNMAIEKYLINLQGGLKIENFNKLTLENLDNVLSVYLEALRRLV